MDKRSQSQFNLQPLPRIDTGEGVPDIYSGTGVPAIGPAKEGTQFLRVETTPFGSPLPFIGGAASRMQAISNNEREAGVDKGARSLNKAGANGKWRMTDTKKGRSELASDLGLPNKKEFKKKKK